MKKSRNKKKSTHVVGIPDLSEICKLHPQVIPVIGHLFVTLGAPCQQPCETCDFYYCCGRRG
jgi:hypothetical protein